MMQHVKLIVSSLLLILVTGCGSDNANDPSELKGAGQIKIIDRSGCRYVARSFTYEAATEKISGDCKGHAWVRIKSNNSWGAWKNDDNWALLYAPTGRLIQQSQHKSCETCATFTLTP